MEILATLHVLRGTTRSSMIAASIEDAVRVATAGEEAGDFRAVEITDWSGRRLDENAVHEEINRRRASRR
jgi:hypothetical protein